MNARPNSKQGSPSSEEDASQEKKRQANDPTPEQPFDTSSGFHEVLSNYRRKRKSARRNSAGESKGPSLSPKSIAAAADSTRAPAQQLQPFQSGLQAQFNAAAEPNRERQNMLDHLVRQRLQEGFQQAELRGLQLPGTRMSSVLPLQQLSSVHQPLTQTELHELLMLHSNHQQQTHLARRQLPTAAAPSVVVGVAAAQSSLANSPTRGKANSNVSSTSEQGASSNLPGDGGGSSSNISNQDPILENMLQELLRREIAAQNQRILIEQYLATNRQDLIGPGTNNIIRMPDAARAFPYDLGDSGLLAALASRQQKHQHQQQSPPLAAAALPVNALTRPASHGIRRSIPLALSTDPSKLSRYQVLVRQQLELFVADREDCTTLIQGRKKDVVLGQVGLRCIHCAHFPINRRGRGSVYYPRKLTGVYQASQVC